MSAMCNCVRKTVLPYNTYMMVAYHVKSRDSGNEADWDAVRDLMFGPSQLHCNPNPQ